MFMLKLPGTDKSGLNLITYYSYLVARLVFLRVQVFWLTIAALFWFLYLDILLLVDALI